jgi:hypothetical protein
MKSLYLFLFFFPAITFAQNPQSKPITSSKKIVALLKIGTTGVTPEVSYRLNPRFNVRSSVSLLPYNKKEIVSFDQGTEKVQMQYDGKVLLGNAGVLIDYYPFKKIVAINTGIFYNFNSFDVALLPKSDIKFNNKIFTPDETGTLNLKVNYNKVAPYLGLSFGNPNNKKTNFMLDIGALYTGSPLISMSGTGSIEPTASQAPKLQENLKPAYLYPVFRFGISVALTK